VIYEQIETRGVQGYLFCGDRERVIPHGDDREGDKLMVDQGEDVVDDGCELTEFHKALVHSDNVKAMLSAKIFTKAIHGHPNDKPGNHPNEIAGLVGVGRDSENTSDQGGV
jgi:hypothetical protein